MMARYTATAGNTPPPAKDRGTLLRRLSDGFLPPKLFDVVWFETGPVVLNGWTLVHMGTGIAARWLGVGFGTWLSLHNAWEAFQVAIGDTDLSSTVDLVDVAADTAAALVGWSLVI